MVRQALPWLATAALVCLAAAAMLTATAKRTTRAAPPRPSAPLSPAAREAAARAVALDYLAAPDWRARLPFLMDEERVRPMVEDFHLRQGRPDLPGGTRLGKVVDAGQPTRILCYAVFIEPGGRSHPAAFRWSEDAFKLDWESWSAYGTMPWSRVLREKPESPQTLRVYLDDAPALPPALRPDVPESWKRVVITHRDSPESLDSWVADPSVAADTAPILRSGDRAPATIQLAFLPAGTGKEAVIQSIVHPHWSP